MLKDRQKQLRTPFAARIAGPAAAPAERLGRHERPPVRGAGFGAVATTSGGLAWDLGYADGEKAPWREVVAAHDRIVRAVRVPVTADIEAGYGDTPAQVAKSITEILDTGVVGFNLEDGTIPARYAGPAESRRCRANPRRTRGSERDRRAGGHQRPVDLYIKNVAIRQAASTRRCGAARPISRPRGLHLSVRPGRPGYHRTAGEGARQRTVYIVARAGTPPVADFEKIGVARISIRLERHPRGDVADQADRRGAACQRKIRRAGSLDEPPRGAEAVRPERLNIQNGGRDEGSTDFRKASPQGEKAMMVCTCSSAIAASIMRCWNSSSCGLAAQRLRHCIDMHTKELCAPTAKASSGSISAQRLARVAVLQRARARAALAWTEAVTLVAESQVPDDIYDEARKQFSEEELVNLTMALVAINAANAAQHRLPHRARQPSGAAAGGRVGCFNPAAALYHSPSLTPATRRRQRMIPKVGTVFGSDHAQ